MSLRCKKCGRFIPADAEFRIIDGENYCETCTPSEPTQTALIETDTLRVRGVNTRRNERRFVTDSPAEMRDLFLASPLRREWKEDFIDETTGETVTVERSEIIAQSGAKIDDNLLCRIQFHLQAGDIAGVEVSTQQRMAYLATSCYLIPWSVTAIVGSKKRKFLLYADSAQMALDIAKDYIELNCSGSFHFVGLKVFEHCVFIKDTLKAVDPDPNDEGLDVEKQEFYKIEAEIRRRDNDSAYNETFVLLAKDVDSAVVTIHDWIVCETRNNPHLDEEEKAAAADFDMTILSGVTIPCYRVIEKEFSEAYMQPVP